MPVQDANGLRVPVCIRHENRADLVLVHLLQIRAGLEECFEALGSAIACSVPRWRAAKLILRVDVSAGGDEQL